MKFDIRLGVTALVLFSVTVMPIAYFHEVGHKVICESQGGEARIGPPTNNGIDAVCLHSKAPVIVMRFFGGFFGAIAGFSPLIGYPWLKNKIAYRAALVAYIPQGIVEFPKSILEAFYYNFYASEIAGQMLFSALLVTLVCFFIILGRKKEHQENHWMPPE